MLCGNKYINIKLILIVISIIILTCYIIFPKIFLFYPIVENISDTSIIRINYNKDFINTGKEGFTEILEYNEKNILSCLSKYNEFSSFEKAESYYRGDVEIEITLREGDKIKNILLGNINYTYISHGSMKHKIYNADLLRNELKRILKEGEY